jgi:hypothetical protein
VRPGAWWIASRLACHQRHPRAVELLVLQIRAIPSTHP